MYLQTNEAPEHVSALVEFMAWFLDLTVTNNLARTIISGKIAAVQCFHGVEVPEDIPSGALS